MKQFFNLIIKLFGIVCLLIFFQWFFSIGHILSKGILFDFGYFLRASQNAVLKINPYFAENFTYPPPVLFLFIPFFKLPLFWSQIFWTLFSAICLVLSIIFSLKTLDWKQRKYSNKFFIFYFLFFILLSFPVRWTFGLGQVNFLLLFFVVLTYFLANKKKDFWSGICLGMAVILKMTPLFLLFYFLVKKRWKIVAISLLTIFLLLVLSGIVFGFNLTKDYLTIIVPKLFEPISKHGYYNQAFSGLSAGIISNAKILNILNFSFAGIILLTDFWVFLKTKTINVFDYSLAICSMLLINGFSWQHHFALLIFPFLVLFKVSPCLSISLGVNRKERPCEAISYLPLAISYLLISYNIKQPELLGDSFFAKIALAHVFWGTLLLLFLLKKGINEQVLS